jgi:hypothetical protein
MPDRDVSTIKDLIYYQYAKIIARSARHAEKNFIIYRMYLLHAWTDFLQEVS